MKRDINQLKAGIVLNYIIIGVNALVGLLYTPYMLRMMGQSEYGLYSLVASVISYLTILDLGFGNAIIRYTAKYRAEGKVREQYELFGMFTALYLFIGVIAFGAGLALYFNVEALFGSTMTVEELSKARIMMLLLSFNLAFTFPMSIFGSIINAYEKFVFVRILNIGRILLNTLVMIILLYYGYKAVAMVVVQTIFNVLTLCLNYVYSKYRIKIKIIFEKFNWSLLKEIAAYSFWIFLAAIVDRIYMSTGQIVLGAVAGTATVAVFSVAMTLNSMYQQFSTAMTSVFLPRVTSMVTLSKADNEISNLFVRTGRLQYIVLSFLLSGYIIFGRYFINLWAGPRYEDAYIVGLFLLVPGTIPLCENLGITIMQARNQMKFRSLSYLIIAVCSIFFQIMLGKQYGGIGCAIAIAVSTLLGHIIIMNIYYYRTQRIDIFYFFKELFKMSVMPFIVCTLGIVISHYLQCFKTWFELGIGICAFSILYVILAILVQMNSDEKKLFMSIINKIRMN